MPSLQLARLPLAIALATVTSACVSLGGAEPPTSLLRLTPNISAPIGETRSIMAGDTIVVREPEVPAEIDVLRVPVRVDDTSLAYLQEAVWVEKPARLFRRLLAETIRVKTGRVVIDGDAVGLASNHLLRGTIREFGYDAAQSAVVVQYDAVLRTGDKGIATRRFEVRKSGIAPDVTAVGPALNQAANELAGQVSDWVESPS